MAFDACEHKLRQLVITAGQIIREIKGLPEELNVTVLFNETAPLLGIPVIQLNSRQDGGHMPAPHEMKNNMGNFVVPRRDCPNCGRKDGLSLKSICPSCTDSESGKYHTMYSCEEIGSEGKLIGCGFKTDKSEKFMAQRISEENPDWEGGMKKDMGISTITDDGVK